MMRPKEYYVCKQCLNRTAALHNVQYTCPELSNFVRNIYSSNAELFLPNSKEIIYSEEGTTQGGPESIGFYAVSTMMLVNPDSAAKKIFYADDGSGGGKLNDLQSWWGDLQKNGPLFGYFSEPQKTWLLADPTIWSKVPGLRPDMTSGQK